jgi:hypothetical protein
MKLKLMVDGDAVKQRQSMMIESLHYTWTTSLYVSSSQTIASLSVSLPMLTPSLVVVHTIGSRLLRYPRESCLKSGTPST